MLEENLNLPSNGKLYSKVISWVQRSLWESGDPLEKLMDEVNVLLFLYILKNIYSYKTLWMIFVYENGKRAVI